MKKVTLLLLLIICVSAIYAQTDSNKTSSNLPKNEFQVGMGDALMSLGLINKDFAEANDLSPAFSLSFHSRIKSWLWFGVSFVYLRQGNGVFTVDNTYFFSGNANMIALMPSIRFSYINKANLLLYSGGQIGVYWCSYERPIAFDSKLNEINLFGQITALGFTYGKNFYIGAEIGFGGKGIFNFVAGYRF